MRRMQSGTARRLGFAFGCLVIILGAAAYVALRALDDLHERLHEVKHREDAAIAALHLADAVRSREDVARALDELVDEASELGMADDAKALRTAIERGEDEAAIVARCRRLAAQLTSSVGNFEAHGAAVQHSAVDWALALSSGAILFAVAIGVYIGRSVSRPLKRLRAGADRIATGDLETRIEVDGRDEFAQLATHFNRMAAALKQHQHRLVETERLAAVGRLAAGVAHEINNPLAVILGYLRMMRKTASGSLAEELAIIEDEAVRCQEIIEGLLDLSRPPRGEPATVELREICEGVVARVREAAACPHVRVRIDGDATIKAHEPQLRQVLFNLVKNAAEAAAPDGEVQIRISSDGEQASIAVRDSGLGLPPDASSRLFEPFFTTKDRGTGLGLAVSQSIARAHGGSIDASSPDDGGALFVLRLPTREGIQELHG